MVTSRRCGSGCFSGRRPSENSQPIGSRRKTSRSWSRQTFCRSWSSRRSGDQNSRAARRSRRRQRLDPEAGLSLLDEERLPQSHREPSDRGPGRGPLGLAGLRSGTFRRLASRGSPPGRSCRARWPTGPGRPAAGIRTLALRLARERARRPRSPRRRLELASSTSTRRRRFRRAGRPRRGEKSPAVEVLGQHRLDGSRGLDRGEHERSRRRLEESQLQEHGRKRRL